MIDKPDDLPADWDDNPEWTEADFARARPASEVVSPAILAQLVRPSVLHPGIGWARQQDFAQRPALGTLRAA